MPRRKKEDLAEFQDWLVRDRFIADSTACTYASNTRAVLNFLEDPQDEGMVTRDFKRLGHLASRRKVTAYRTAWKRFIEWADVAKNVPLAFPGLTPIHRGPPPLGHEVRAALAFLTQKGHFLQKQVPSLRWSMILPTLSSQDGVELPNPFVRGERIWIPSEHFQHLMEWSGFKPGDDAPLIPLKFGSSIAYPGTAFRRELKQYRKDVEPLPVPDLLWREAQKEAINHKAAQEGVRVPGIDMSTPEAHTTQALIALIEQGPPAHDPQQSSPHDPSDSSDPQRESLPAEGRPPPGVREQESKAPDSKAPETPEAPPPCKTLPLPKTSPDPNEPPLCSLCHHPFEAHAAHYGLTDGTLPNCAKENGYPEDSCQMCRGTCPGRHDFVSRRQE